MADARAAQGEMTRIETYVPLYRKYRPQTFADLVGQEAISQTLGNAIRLNKVAHAYLFCGPRGTGKTSAARIFAKSLNCEQGPTVTPCLQCATCVGIAAGNALDVVEFDAASNNGVNDARELIENCQYTSMTGRFKVYIIDEVHMLTNQAFNTLLKTLEEPPPGVIFIFATTEAHKVLPTIISRCQRFDFNRITTQDIIARLRHIAQAEDIAIDEDALALIARHARGGLRDAVGLLDQVAVLGRSQSGKVVGRKDVALFIGTLEEELLLRLSAAIAERRAADLLHDLGELLNRGIEPVQLLKELTVHFRNLLLIQAAGESADPDLLMLPPDYFVQLRAQTALFPEVEELPQIIGRLAEIERNVRQGSQPQLWLEVGLMALAYRHEIHLVKELSERLSRLEAQLAGGAVPLIAAPVPRSQPQPMPSARPAAASVAPAASSAPTGNSEPSVSRPVSPPPAAQQHMPVAAAMPELPPVRDIASPVVNTPTPVAPSAGSVPAMPPAAAPRPETASASSSSDSSMEATFQRICQAVKSVNVKSILQQQAFPLSLAADRLTVGIRSEALLTTLRKPEKLIHLQKAADEVLGRPMQVDLTFAKKTESPPVAPEPPVPPSASNAGFSANPAIAPVPQAPPVSEPPLAEARFTASLVVSSNENDAKTPESAPASLAEPEAPITLTEPASFDDAPPLLDEAPPMTDEPWVPMPPAGAQESDASLAVVPDEEESEPINGNGAFKPEASVDVAEMAMAGLSSDDPQLAEAKKHALQVMQGKLLD